MDFQIKYPINRRKSASTASKIIFVARVVSPMEKDGPKATSRNGKCNGSKDKKFIQFTSSFVQKIIVAGVIIATALRFRKIPN